MKKPTLAETAKIAGGLALTVILMVYLARTLPFVLIDSEVSDLDRIEAEVVDRLTDSLSGSTNENAQTYALVLRVQQKDTSPRDLRAPVTRDTYEATQVGDTRPVVRWRNRYLAVDDLRWTPKMQRRFWLALVASVFLCAETLRRIVAHRSAK